MIRCDQCECELQVVLVGLSENGEIGLVKVMHKIRRGEGMSEEQVRDEVAKVQRCGPVVWGRLGYHEQVELLKEFEVRGGMSGEGSG